MTETTAAPARPAGPPDFRAELTAAQAWVAGLIDNVGPDQYGLPTPCAEYDVEALLQHLYGVADRVLAAGGGRDPVSVPPYDAPLPDDVAGGFRERVEAARVAWTDDDALGRLLEAPWGQAPGAVVAAVYVSENLAHGWDLALATGQDSEADPRLAAIALQTMQRALPADGRDVYPFADPITPAADAGPTEQLANWLGRSRP